MITLISPADKAQFSILSAAQTEFIRRAAATTPEEAGTVPEKSYSWLDLRVNDAPETSQAASVIIKWKNTEPLHKSVVQLSTDPDFAVTERIATVGPICYNAEDDTFFSVVNNLLSGTTYYWRISVGDELSETRIFSTNPGEIRTIRAEGVGNVRDIGGRFNTEGKRIRQGLVYRGAQMNNLLSPSCSACNGIGVLRDDLGIKTDIDLRFEAVGKYEFCPLGDHVKYHLFTADGYEGIFNDWQDELFRNIIELFADENNYPIYFHCVSGADRTGTLGLILDAILGLSDEDLITDYNLTALSEVRCWYANAALFIKELNKRYPGLSLKEQVMTLVRNYLCIPEDTIERIRHNLLED